VPATGVKVPDVVDVVDVVDLLQLRLVLGRPEGFIGDGSAGRGKFRPEAALEAAPERMRMADPDG